METVKPQKEKSNSTRNLAGRKHSIMRGTASSRAKAVKSIDTHNNLQQRRLSVRTKTPSLTNLVHNLPQQRRSSCSIIEKPAPSPSSLVSSPTVVSSRSPERKISVDRSMSSSNSSSSSVSTRVHSSCSKKATVTTPEFFKYNEEMVAVVVADAHAAEEQENQQIQMNPLETPVVLEEIIEQSAPIPNYIPPPPTPPTVCTACNQKINKTSKSNVSLHSLHHETSSSEDIMSMVRTRSQSPTSPIPTRGHNRSVLGCSAEDQVIIEEPEEMDEEEAQIVSAEGVVSTEEAQVVIADEEQQQTKEDNVALWNKLLQHQKNVVEFINHDQETMITLSNTTETNDTRVILEAQVELLKRFETMLLLSRMTPPQVSASTNEITVEPKLPITSWQTKIEYSLTQFKWNLSQWFGTIVGTAQLEQKAYDSFGNTDDIIISGVCVTTEPGLLPKRLQRYYTKRGELIYHKYVIHISRQDRLEAFQLMSISQWQEDHVVKQCEFKEKKVTCHITFNLTHRRHHCRSCGHLFCQTHCSNLLPLFISNNQERGEWSRVCDTCFYARIDPQFITK